MHVTERNQEEKVLELVYVVYVRKTTAVPYEREIFLG